MPQRLRGLYPKHVQTWLIEKETFCKYEMQYIQVVHLLWSPLLLHSVSLTPK